MADEDYDDAADAMLPPEQAGLMTDHQSASKMPETPEGAPPEERDPKAGQVRNVSIRPAANGGFIANCDREAPPSKDGSLGGYSPSKDYAFKSFDELVAYLRTELA